MSNHIEVFTNIYETCHWGNNNDEHYKGSSGDGSSVKYNRETYIPFLRNFITEHRIKSVVDLGCGDFRFGPHIYDDLTQIESYHGYDAYAKVIENNQKQMSSDSRYHFTHLDFLHAHAKNPDQITSADLCILKDVLQHWSLKEIYEFLDYLTTSGKFKYILICNCDYQTEDDTDISAGGWRPLSCKFYPLRKYNPVKLYNYGTKEVSVITCSGVGSA